MIHDLKILPEYFVEVVRGNKTFEVRKDDRPFNVGDELILHEVNCGRYTGRNIKVIITYILRNPDYCKEGYCILGFKQPVKRGRWIWKERHRNSYRVVKGIDKYGKEGDLQIHEEYKVKVNYCSVCGKQGHEAFLNFCPNCGAKMLEKPNLQLLKNAVDLIQKAKEIKVDGARMDGDT